MLFVFSGKGRSGKDTAASMLCEVIKSDNLTVLTIAYADFLKEILSKCFNLTHDQLYGKLKEIPIEGLKRNTGAFLEHNIYWTPRELLQYLGTDIMRSIDSNCWINVVKNFVDTYSNYDNIIITDGRFNDEIDWVIEREGIHIHMERTERSFINGTSHASETSLSGFTDNDNTYIVYNDDSLEDLKNKITSIWRKYNGRKQSYV
jgi:hypothetical protein